MRRMSRGSAMPPRHRFDYFGAASAPSSNMTKSARIDTTTFYRSTVRRSRFSMQTDGRRGHDDAA